MIHYRDFITKRKRFTRGKFVRWDQAGPLNAWGIVVRREHSSLFIPYYLISSESLLKLPPKPKEKGA